MIYSVAVFFDHGVQLRISYSPEKKRSIELGDLSGQVVHPVLVHLAHLWGCVFWQQSHSRHVRDETIHLKLALDALDDQTRRAPNVVEALQAYTLLTGYAYFRRDTKSGHDYARCAAELVRLHNMHILDASLLPLTELTEECQAVCWHLYFISTPFSPIPTTSDVSRRLNEELDALIVSRVPLISKI